MSKITVFIENRFGNKSNSFTVGELSKALEYTEQKDTTKQEDKILKWIFSFGNTDTKQVMCPRIDVFALSEKLTLDEIGRRIALGDFKELNVIIKGDVDGSVEALTDSFQNLSTEEIQVNIIFKAVGAITESDVLLASGR